MLLPDGGGLVDGGDHHAVAVRRICRWLTGTVANTDTAAG
jgi:hypothetical protein